jgi:hypothetical protein
MKKNFASSILFTNITLNSMAASRASKSIFEGEVSLLIRRWEHQTYNFKMFMKEDVVSAACLKEVAEINDEVAR